MAKIAIVAVKSTLMAWTQHTPEGRVMDELKHAFPVFGTISSQRWRTRQSEFTYV